jgi:hypothetical protein
MISLRYIFLCITLPVLCFGQGHKETNWEIGGFLGAANYIGDLAPDLSLKMTRPAIGVSAKYNFNSYLSAGGQLNAGWIAGNDSNFESLKYRGLAFRSSIFEVSGIMEFNFLHFGNGPRDRRISPYLYTGLSFFKFNPVADYEGDKYYLQRMSTEGQDVIDNAPKKYSLLQFAIPLGAGFKFKMSDNWNLAVHGAYRGTFTDYLDDVSGTYVDNDALESKAGTASAGLADPNGVGKNGKQRGNPQIKDWYVFAGITLSYVLPGRICYTF